MIFLLLLSLTSPQLIEVDRVEINKTTSATSSFTQVILYRWTRLSTGSGYHVADWKIADPQATYHSGRHWVRYDDDGVMREIITKHLRRTKTDIDPELLDRSSLPQDLRRSYYKETQ